MNRYQNKYRIASARAAWWNYGWSGAYFITICTKNREHYFGEIINDKMHLSHCGVIADLLWHEIPHHAIDVDLGAFEVMPNHIHGILILNTDNDKLIGTVETGHALSLPHALSLSRQSESQKRFRNPGKNTASTIIGGYKSAVTKHANRLEIEFAWQSRFHDHIIRDNDEYQRINDYIENNVQNWNDDKFNGNKK